MSMMNANAAATTAMTANEPLDFVLPEMGDADFSSEELAEDMPSFLFIISVLPSFFLRWEYWCSSPRRRPIPSPRA